MLPLHHGFVKRTTRIERASPEWRSGALPAELRPRENARLESNQRPLPSQSSALPLSYGRVLREPPAGVEPAPRPYKGRVLAVDTTEAKVETAGIEPASCSVQARGALPEHVPVRCGRVESNHHSARQRRYRPLSSPVLSVRRRGDRPDSNRRLEAHNLGCCRYTTATMWLRPTATPRRRRSRPTPGRCKSRRRSGHSSRSRCSAAAFRPAPPEVAARVGRSA